MLNMNSPVVQNLMQSQSGFNPYNGYVPQQQIQQPNYYGYNPYAINQQNKEEDPLDNWEYSYDPMPKRVVNISRGINTNIESINSQMGYNNPYNNYAFNGYTNPILMRNQIEAEKIKKREYAINQGKIWRTLLQSEKSNNTFDIDEEVKRIESMYYSEPVQENIPIKDKIYMEKNKYFAELEAKLDYYRNNNIPIIDQGYIINAKLANYYNHINDIIGDPDNCGMFEYFSKVYPELRYEELNWQLERQRRNLKNKYNSNEFNNLINDMSKDRSDSYYYKLMESFSEDGVRLTNNDGLVITPDQMEIKLPDRLIKNKQDRYYEQRKKFYESVFSKE